MLQKIINRALELGFNDVQITVVESNSAEIKLFQGKVEKNFIGEDKKYFLQGIINGKSSKYVFAKDDSDFTDEEIDNILLKLKENVLTTNSTEEFSIFEGSKSYPTITPKPTNIDKLTVNDRIQILKDIEKKAFAYDERIELVPELEFSEDIVSLNIVNSKGLNLSSKKNEYYIVLGVVAGASKEDPNKRENYDVAILKNIEDFDIDKFVNKVCADVLKELGGAPVESKVYPVLMDRDAMASLLSGFFSMFSGEALLRGLTGLKGELGKQVMSELITITDDPLDENAEFQDAFDAEGVATFTKKVVDKGVFKMFLHNLKTAKVFNTEPTGNATIHGIAGNNFHIENGKTPLEDVIASVKEGILIKDMMGLHAGLNPISGDFSAQSQGFLIKDGKIDRPVTLIVVSGNFLKMLNDIEYVADDFKYSYTGYGSPSILFKGLPVSGK